MNALEAARRLAAALDAEDYDATRRLLAPDCVYHTGTEGLSGADAIVASYRAHGEDARTRFERVTYESSVSATGPATAAITYTDHVSHQGRSHAYRCRQHVRVRADGAIDEIRHEDLPGERERFFAFTRGE